MRYVPIRAASSDGRIAVLRAEFDGLRIDRLREGVVKRRRGLLLHRDHELN